uniref:Gustatory receptor n=1 Tax=Tetranychus urticae TaxID=32264 RepID=A0A158P598_TETUR
MEMNLMVLSTKSSKSVQKGYFLKDLVNLFRYSFVTPDPDKADLCAAQIVQRTERLTIIFQVLRNGLDQNNSSNVNTFGYRRYNWLDWIIAIVALINWFRCIGLICNSSDTVNIILGDPLFRSKDRLACIILAFITLTVLFSFREWILSLENKGNIGTLSIWKFCRYSFNPVYLEMDKLNVNRFRLIVISVSVVSYCTIFIGPLFASFVFIIPLLTNPWMNKIPELLFFCFLWSLSEIFIASFLLSAVLGFSWYLICTFSFHSYRLLNLIYKADYLKNSTAAVYARDVQLLCLLIIRRLNSFELAVRKVRYVILYICIVLTLLCDTFIFLGLIVRVYNDFLANLLATVGIFGLPSIGVFGYIFGNFISELDKLTVRLHRLALNNKLSLKETSKVLEVMDRVAGPYNGLKVGDFLTVERSFFIFYVLENITTLMLFTVNIGPLIK